MIDTVVFTPATHGIISLVPLYKSELLLHAEGFEIKRFARHVFGDNKIRVIQENTGGPKDQGFLERVWIDPFS